MACHYPIHKYPLTWLPSWSIRIMIIYGSLAVASLGVEIPTKLPAYMGFFLSKAISMGWGLLKTYNYLPGSIIFEKQIGLALLAGLIGIVSAKKARMRALKEAKHDVIEEKVPDAAKVNVEDVLGTLT